MNICLVVSPVSSFCSHIYGYHLLSKPYVHVSLQLVIVSRLELAGFYTVLVDDEYLVLIVTEPISRNY